MKIYPSSDALRTLISKLPRPERGIRDRGDDAAGFTGFEEATDLADDETDQEILERLKRQNRLAGNAVLLGGAEWIADQISEVGFYVAEKLDGENNWKFDETHEASIVVNGGNQWNDNDDVLGEAVMDYIDGNAYLYVNDVRGRPTDLWWRPARNMSLKSDNRNPLSAYYFTPPGGGKGSKIEPKSIIHVRHKISSIDPRLGRPMYLAAFREIDADNEAARVVAEIFRYSLMSNVLFQWSKNNGLPLTQNERAEFQRAVRAALGRGRRGSPAFSGDGELTIHEIGNHISNISVKEHRDNFESRILLGLKIQALVLGLESGIEFPSKEVFRAAERDSWNKGVIPIMETFERAFTKQFLWRRWPEAKTKKLQFKFDLRSVDALREDYDTKLENEKIWMDRLLSGGTSLGRYKDGIGEEKDDGDDDIYYLPIDHIVVKKADMLKVAENVMQNSMPNAFNGAEPNAKSPATRNAEPTNNGRRSN